MAQQQTSRTSENIDIILLIDNSGSMQQQHNDPNKWRLTAANIIATYARESDRISVLLFNDEVTYLNSEIGIGFPNLSLLSERYKRQLQNHLQSIEARGYTDIVHALTAAYSILESSEKRDRQVLILLLTDGVPELNPDREEIYRQRYGTFPIEGEDWYSYLLPVLEQFQRRGWKIHAMGIQEGHSPFLQTIAQRTDGNYRRIDDTRHIVDFYLDRYQEISGEFLKDFREARQYTHTLEEPTNQSWETTQLTFTLFSDNGLAQVDGLSCNNYDYLTSASISVVQWDRPVEGSFKIYRIEDPPTGDWNISISGEGEVNSWVARRTDVVIPPTTGPSGVTKLDFQVTFVRRDGTLITNRAFHDRIEEVMAIVKYNDREWPDPDEIPLQFSHEEGEWTGTFSPPQPTPPRPINISYSFEARFQNGEMVKGPGRAVKVMPFTIKVPNEYKVLERQILPGDESLTIPFRLNVTYSGPGSVDLNADILAITKGLFVNGQMVVPKENMQISHLHVSSVPTQLAGQIRIINLPEVITQHMEGKIRFEALHTAPDSLIIRLMPRPPVVRVGISKMPRVKKGEKILIRVKITCESLYDTKDLVVRFIPSDSSVITFSLQEQTVSLAPEDDHSAEKQLDVVMEVKKWRPWFMGTSYTVEVSDPEGIFTEYEFYEMKSSQKE